MQSANNLTSSGGTVIATKVEEIDANLNKYKNEETGKNYPSYEDSPTFWNSMTGEAFDEYSKAKGWNQPENITKLVGPGQIVDLDTKTAEIIDIGCGTGIVGQFLGKIGYSGIVGADVSPNLLAKAKEVEAYKELRELFIGMGVDKFPDDLKNRFDMVTAAGVWNEGHIPSAGLDDCFAALKVGGYLVSSTRNYIWVKGGVGGYKDRIDKFVEEGQVEIVHTQNFNQGFGAKTGPWADNLMIAFIVRKLK